MEEKHSPMWQKGYHRNHLAVLAEELGNCGSPHTLPQISQVPLVMSLCSPAPQFPGCSPATRSRPRFPPLPGFVGCVRQRPWHSYNRRAFQIPEINREPTEVFTYRMHERFHFDRQTQTAAATRLGPGSHSEAASGCWLMDPLGAPRNMFDTPLHNPGFGVIWVVLRWPDKHFWHGFAYKTFTVGKFGRLPFPTRKPANRNGTGKCLCYINQREMNGDAIFQSHFQ